MQISQALPTKELSPLRFYHMNFIPLNIKTWKDQRGICSKHAIFSPQLSAPCHSEHRGRATAQHLGFSFQEDPENDTHTTCLDQICNQLDPRFLWEKHFRSQEPVSLYRTPHQKSALFSFPSHRRLLLTSGR